MDMIDVVNLANKLKADLATATKALERLANSVWSPGSVKHISEEALKETKGDDDPPKEFKI